MSDPTDTTRAEQAMRPVMKLYEGLEPNERHERFEEAERRMRKSLDLTEHQVRVRFEDPIWQDTVIAELYVQSAAIAAELEERQSRQAKLEARVETYLNDPETTGLPLDLAMDRGLVNHAVEAAVKLLTEDCLFREDELDDPQKQLKLLHSYVDANVYALQQCLASRTLRGDFLTRQMEFGSGS